jgi:hypothetical protein
MVFKREYFVFIHMISLKYYIIHICNDIIFSNLFFKRLFLGMIILILVRIKPFFLRMKKYERNENEKKVILFF